MSDETRTATDLVIRLREGDPMADALGVDLVEAGPGTATVSLTVRDDMGNAFGMCHGGVIFSLADCAFEYASNSHGPATVAASAAVDFVRPVTVGTTLTAVCQERYRGRVAGNYDVEVTDSSGRTVALFRARSHEIGDRPTPE